MPGDAVVDASALAALLFGEPDGETVVRRLQGRRLLAPTLLRYELASVCLKKARAHPALAPALRSALELFGGMGVHEVQVPAADLAETAEEGRLTAYDAACLWLARSQDAELVTLDATLDATLEKAWRGG